MITDKVTTDEKSEVLATDCKLVPLVKPAAWQLASQALVQERNIPSTCRSPQGVMHYSVCSLHGNTQGVAIPYTTFILSLSEVLRS